MQATTTTPISRFTFKVKYFLSAMLLLLSFYGIAQTTTTVNYTPSSVIINNPERGFYRHTETHSTSYSSLNQTTLNNYRTNNTTLILRVFYLESFKSTPISSAYLSAMQDDFIKIRNAGLKCIVRFAYSDNDVAGQRDASKAQILAHITQVKPILIANVDVISVMQAGFIGSWGEWYYTDHFGMAPTTTDYANRKEVVDGILSALPTSRMIQIRTPSLKQKTYTTTTALTQSQAFNGTNISRIGHHNDCFLASSSDFGTYSNTSTEYPYLEQETKFTPMGGETCAVNEPRSACTSALYEMQKFHWSYLNLDYNPNVISGFQSGSCFTEIQNKLGYRFELVNGTFPQSASIGTAMPITFKVKNNGFASPYNQRTVYLVLRNTSSNQEYPITLNTDPRLWSSGVEQTITQNVTLPANIIAGSYKLYLKLPDTDSALSTRPEYSIRMANETTWESTTGYNDLKHTVTIGGATLGNNDPIPTLEMKIYPVPADNELIIEFDGISNYKVTVYNSLGQRVSLSSTLTTNKMILNTQGLSSGVYFVQFQNNNKKETRRVVVSH
ncbi:DUF4832 domain-containing protein [Flavobacterium sp.]|uniref:T9SS type A sorting domain-containing protein n=1 Tax=Flavobacterium sp. TaxID=239 RepID=UPI002B4AE350|nr:DUF4832 domain-containing protein [Flavobacterium sp.]HLF52854.1 DUF4832 domain-containing protein [Flavobacterium sp.]